jgi:hypothetical protein
MKDWYGSTAEPYVGKYFSQDYLRRKILRQTDQEIIEQDALDQKRNSKRYYSRSKYSS